MRKKYIVSVLILALIIQLCGCGTSYIVTPTQGGGDYSYNDLASEFDGKEADIILKEGSEIHGSQIRVSVDSLYWTDPVSRKHYAVAVNKVQGISRTNHLIGALKGLGFGVLGSAFVLVANTGTGIDDPGFGFAILGTLASPPLGLIVGAIVGHPYDYNFPIDSADTKNK